jgi:hypothetical protein
MWLNLVVVHHIGLLALHRRCYITVNRLPFGAQVGVPRVVFSNLSCNPRARLLVLLPFLEVTHALVNRHGG